MPKGAKVGYCREYFKTLAGFGLRGFFCCAVSNSLVVSLARRMACAGGSAAWAGSGSRPFSECSEHVCEFRDHIVHRGGSIGRAFFGAAMEQLQKFGMETLGCFGR